MNASVIVETARQPHRTVFSECTLKQPLVSPITIGKVLCSGAAVASPGGACRCDSNEPRRPTYRPRSMPLRSLRLRAHWEITTGSVTAIARAAAAPQPRRLRPVAGTTRPPMRRSNPLGKTRRRAAYLSSKVMRLSKRDRSTSQPVQRRRNVTDRLNERRLTVGD
jgi:hypothetical protein